MTWTRSPPGFGEQHRDVPRPHEKLLLDLLLAENLDADWLVLDSPPRPGRLDNDLLHLGMPRVMRIVRIWLSGIYRIGGHQEKE